MRENIIVGDTHGTIDEFNLLLDKINYDPKQHRLILCGDIIDRGRDPVGLLKQIRKMGIESVLANHESKCLRWRKYEALKELTGKENPMAKISPKRAEEWMALSKNDLHWMSNLPLKINIKDNWYVVHAGMEPAIAFDKQDPEQIIRIRFVDEKGKVSKERPTPNNPIPGIYFWAERWNQPYNIIFGHQRFDEPKIFKNSNNTCVGIDTGAVFGNKLTAYNLDKNTFTFVNSKKSYYKKD